MKYIKHIDELKSDTYRLAGQKLQTIGHPTRANSLIKYGDAIRSKEVEKMVIDAQAKLDTDLILLDDELKKKSLCEKSFKLRVKASNSGGISVDTDFYLTGFFCPQASYGIRDYIANEWLGVEIMPIFSFVDIVEENILPNKLWPNEKSEKVKVAKIIKIQPFRLGVSTSIDISEFEHIAIGRTSKDIEEMLYDKATVFTDETYNDYNNICEIHWMLTSRKDARLIADEFKKTFSDDGEMFKEFYKMIKDQDIFDEHYHAILSAFQRAFMNKLSLNKLYSE